MKLSLLAFALMLGWSGAARAAVEVPVIDTATVQALIGKEVVWVESHLRDSESAEKMVARGRVQIGTLQGYVYKKRIIKLVLRTKDHGVTQIRQVYFDRDMKVLVIAAASKDHSKPSVNERYYFHEGVLISWQPGRDAPLSPPNPASQARATALWQEMTWYLSKAAGSENIIDTETYGTDLEMN